MSNNQAQTFLASCLPDDEELIQREKTWLNIFDKFSIDEGSDAELDEENEQDSNTMSNDLDGSNSDTSIVSNGEDNDNDYDMQKLADELKPAIDERIAVWQEKGIHFAFQTVDPKVAVEMWLQANKECETTTCTKTVTKTVINENGKTTCKETRRTTTTKKAFRTIMRPHLIINNHQNQIDNDMQPITSVTQNSNEKAPSVDKALDGNGLTHLKQTPISKEFSFKKPSARIPTINVSDSQTQLRSRRVPKNKSRNSPKRVHQNKIEKTTKAKNKQQKSHVMEMVSTPMEQQTDSTINSNPSEKTTKAKNTMQKSHLMEMVSTPMEQQTDSTINLNPSSQIVIHSPDHKQIRGTNMLAANGDPQKSIDRNNLRISDENKVPNAGMLINSRIHPPDINAIQSFDSNNSDSEEDILMTSYRGPKSVVLYEPPTQNSIQSFNSNNSDSEEDDILMTSYKNLNCLMLVKL